MEYWIGNKDELKGPFTLDQLHLMWQQGALTADSFYYDNVRSEWVLVQTLLENNRQLFTVEEAFVRLGQNRQTGCLVVYNREDVLHLFVEDGSVVFAASAKDEGEMTVVRALRMEESTYEWFYEMKSPSKNIHLNIHAYALKNAVARDIRLNVQQTKRKNDTRNLSNLVTERPVVKRKAPYLLVNEHDVTVNFQLIKSVHVVGRGDQCDLVIEDNRVSRRHCLLESTEQNVKVKDLDSKNGTLINGKPITDGILWLGDELSLGGYILKLRKEQKRAPELSA